MNKFLMTATFLATFAAGSALAQGPEGMDKDGKFQRPPRAGAMFKKLDANEDGVVSEKEMFEAHQKRFNEHFKSMDANNDGKLTQDEMKKAREKMREKMRSRMKKWGDKKGQRGPRWDEKTETE